MNEWQLYTLGFAVIVAAAWLGAAIGFLLIAPHL
jgi:hypothetical protein